MDPYHRDSLSHDAVHGYIPFGSGEDGGEDEVSERDLIDHPWLQRLRQIHQLQTAWWVFPTAEHTRFQHVLGAMHLASRAAGALYDSLKQSCPDVPSVGYVETLLRVAALLHDVGHGPFGHFFDRHFLADHGLTHETLGCLIIREELGDLLRRVRRNPYSALAEQEQLDPEHIAVLITRPAVKQPDTPEELPQWLRFLRALFSGLYTVDNMDFVLRDAYMSGYSTKAFDLDRLLHYSMFTTRGLTIHERGLSALVRFISVRAELFRSVYYHRTVRAIDLELRDVFQRSKAFLFPGDPRDHLDEYLELTEWSLLVRVTEWNRSVDPQLRELGQAWQRLMRRDIRWKMAVERTIFFRPGESERTSVFSSEELFESALRSRLPESLRGLPLRFDPPRHVHRPDSHAPAAGQNFLYEAAAGKVRTLDAVELFRQIPVSYRLCRIYAEDHGHNAELAEAMDQLTRGMGADDLTNM